MPKVAGHSLCRLLLNQTLTVLVSRLLGFKKYSLTCYDNAIFCLQFAFPYSFITSLPVQKCHLKQQQQKNSLNGKACLENIGTRGQEISE